MADDVAGRTRLDLLLGGLQVLVGLVILAHTGLATALSLLFVGWLLFAAGVVVVAAHLFRVGQEGFWSGLLGGGVIAVLGIVFLRHTGAAALTVTLAAGALFLAVGVARLAAAFSDPVNRVPLLIGGGVSLVLGLVVVLNIVAASFTLLGVLLGVQVLTEGIATMVVGREARRAVLRGTGPTDAPEPHPST